MFNTPILFLLFNRPDTTRKVFAQIRKIRPAYLFIAADGPRKDKAGEKETCAEVRNIVLSQIDWDCEVKTLFRDKNLGCGRAVSQAITWFFEHVEEGIILEDDCLPNLSFFPYCAELLNKYKTDDRIFSISGTSLLGKPWKVATQSYCWALPGIWGWATWRRAWQLYDFKMEKWKDPVVQTKIREGLKTNGWFEFYFPMFESTYYGQLDTWDLQWLYCTFKYSGLTANPSVNLIENIGFGEKSTHQSKDDNLKLVVENLDFPLKHPKVFITDVEYVQQSLLNIRGIKTPKHSFLSPVNFMRRLKRKLFN